MILIAEPTRRRELRLYALAEHVSKIANVMVKI